MSACSSSRCRARPGSVPADVVGPRDAALVEEPRDVRPPVRSGGRRRLGPPVPRPARRARTGTFVRHAGSCRPPTTPRPGTGATGGSTSPTVRTSGPAARTAPRTSSSSGSRPARGPPSRRACRPARAGLRAVGTAGGCPCSCCRSRGAASTNPSIRPPSTAITEPRVVRPALVEQVRVLVRASAPLRGGVRDAAARTARRRPRDPVCAREGPEVVIERTVLLHDARSMWSMLPIPADGSIVDGATCLTLPAAASGSACGRGRGRALRR